MHEILTHEPPTPKLYFPAVNSILYNLALRPFLHSALHIKTRFISYGSVAAVEALPSVKRYLRTVIDRCRQGYADLLWFAGEVMHLSS